MGIANTTTIALSGIAIPLERLRALQPGTVDALAESMKRHGLLHAITVRKRAGRGYWVVAGAHRLTAAEKLRWKVIECVVLDECTPDEAELVEIDENLIRAELSPAERALHIGRRKEIYERQHGSAKANGARAAHRVMGRGDANANLADAFAKDTAAKTGQSERNVQRDATRAKRVEVLADVVGTCLDKGTELDALARLSGLEQRELAARAKAGQKVSARGPRNPPKPPRIDMNVIKQAGAFHVELTNYTQEFCACVKQWHAANNIDDESHDCVVQALEMASMRLQLTAQDIDGR